MPLGDTFIRSRLTDLVLLDHLSATRLVIVTGSQSQALGRQSVGHLATTTKMPVDLVRCHDRDEWQCHSAREKDPPKDAVNEDHADEASRPDAHGDRVLADPGRHLVAGPHVGIGDQRGRASAARLGGDGCFHTRLAIGHQVSLRLLPGVLEYSVA